MHTRGKRQLIPHTGQQSVTRFIFDAVPAGAPSSYPFHIYLHTCMECALGEELFWYTCCYRLRWKMKTIFHALPRAPDSSGCSFNVDSRFIQSYNRCQKLGWIQVQVRLWGKSCKLHVQMSLWRERSIKRSLTFNNRMCQSNRTCKICPKPQDDHAGKEGGVSAGNGLLLTAAQGCMHFLWSIIH